jgi:hypothetical protein
VFESPGCTRTRHSDNIEDLWGTVFYTGDPDLIMSCLTLAHSLVRHWQTQLPDAMADYNTQMRGTVGSYVRIEKPAETQTRIRHTEYTELQPLLSGVLSVMRVKSVLAGEGGGCTPTPSHYIYPHQ